MSQRVLMVIFVFCCTLIITCEFAKISQANGQPLWAQLAWAFVMPLIAGFIAWRKSE